MNQMLIRKIVEMEDLVTPLLFKPVQFGIIKKLNVGKKLNENEKRYLRGKMKDKLALLNRILIKKNEENNTYSTFLDSLGFYYITGLEALKHNGFGWYFDTKVIEVINTKIQGKIILDKKTLKLIRVKSITKAKYMVDKKTGLKYATNEQIFNDTRITKNSYARLVWIQLLSRYTRFFSNNYKKYLNLLKKPIEINYSKYGV